MKKILSCFLVGILIFSFMVPQIEARVDETQKENQPGLESPFEHVPGRLLIKFKNDLSSPQITSAMGGLRDSVSDEIPQINVKVLSVPDENLDVIQEELRNNPLVEFVEKDWIFEPAEIPNDPLFSEQWHLNQIRVSEAWEITKGVEEIPIAILDSGLDIRQPDLGDKIVFGYNFYDDNDDWMETTGHGTRVAGAAAAITNNEIGVAGVAWKNNIMPLRITDDEGMAYSSTITKAIIYAADHGARAANISYLLFNGEVIKDAAQYMYEKGGWVIIASGNSGTFEDYPDNPYVINVGATKFSDEIALFSTYGPYLDFVAPGALIYTTSWDDQFSKRTGTSYAAPIVAGVVSLLFSYNPDFTSDDVYQILKISAFDGGDPGYDYKFGWGRVDAGKALLVAQTFEKNPPLIDLINPIEGSTVSGVVTVSAEVSDDNEIDRVEFYVDSESVGTLETKPFEIDLDTTGLEETSHEIMATAYDTSGNEASAYVFINVVNPDSPPVVTITSPDDESVFGEGTSVTLEAVATDTEDGDLGASVSWESDADGPLGTGTMISSVLSVGNHTITASATDSFGNTATDSVSVTVNDGIPPLVKLFEIKGDPEVTGPTGYQVIVTGKITKGPNANTHDEISEEGTTLNGYVLPSGLDDYTFTGDIVSITANKHIFSFVDGVEVPNDSPPVTKLLEIIGDPAVSGHSNYQIEVTGEIMKGPNSNEHDTVSEDGKSVNGYVLPSGLDDYTFTGDIVSITANKHIFSFVDGVEVPNNSTKYTKNT